MAGVGFICRVCRLRPRPLWGSHLGPRRALSAPLGSRSGLSGQRSASSGAAAPPDPPQSSSSGAKMKAKTKAKTKTRRSIPRARAASPAAPRAKRAWLSPDSPDWLTPEAPEDPPRPDDVPKAARSQREPEVVLDEFKISNIELSTTPVTIKDGYMFICSYNNVAHEKKNYTIITPGDAPAWTPPKDYPASLRLRRKYITRHHDFRLPDNHALFKRMQSFVAIEVMRPDFLLDDVDIIIEARVLTQIFSYCFGDDFEGTLQRSNTSKFRLDLFLAGENTLLVEPPRIPSYKLSGFVSPTRKPTPRRRADGQPEDPKDYGELRSASGRAFEQKFTKRYRGAQGNSHQRFLLYRIGDLKVLVETGVDARFEQPPPISLEKIGERDQRHFPMLTAAPGSWLRHQTLPYMADVEVLGRPFPHTQALELKIGDRAKVGGDWAKLFPDALAQCWFSRVSHIAYGLIPKESSMLEDIRMVRMDEACRDWENKVRTRVALHRIPSLLQHLRHHVKGVSKHATHARHRTASVVFDGRDYHNATVKIVLPRHPPEISLSEDFLARWWVSQRPGGAEYLRIEQARRSAGVSDVQKPAGKRSLPSGQTAASSDRGWEAADAKPDHGHGPTGDGRRLDESRGPRHRRAKSPEEADAFLAAAEEDAAWLRIHRHAAEKISGGVPKQDSAPLSRAKSWVTAQSAEDAPSPLKDAIPSGVQSAEAAVATSPPQDLTEKRRKASKTAQGTASQPRSPASEQSSNSAAAKVDDDKDEATKKKIAQLLQFSTVGTFKKKKTAETKVPGKSGLNVEENSDKNIEKKAEEQTEEKVEAQAKEKSESKPGQTVEKQAQKKSQAQDKPQAKAHAKPPAKPATRVAASPPTTFVPGMKRKPPKPPQKPDPDPKESGPPSEIPPQSSTGTYFIPDDIPWP